MELSVPPPLCAPPPTTAPSCPPHQTICTLDAFPSPRPPLQIEAKFNEMRLRLKTTEYANEDLDKYHKVRERGGGGGGSPSLSCCPSFLLHRDS